MKTKKKTSTKKVKPAKKVTKKGMKKGTKKKALLASLAVSAGILSFFGWKYFKNRKTAKASNDFDALLKLNNNLIESPVKSLPAPVISNERPKSTYSNSTSSANSDFPLKKGSRGDLVRQLQEALLQKYGKSVLPRYGADGDFGSETVNALKKLSLPATIDQSTFNVIAAVTKVDVGLVGQVLLTAAASKNYKATISSLKKLKSTEDYAKANEVFKAGRINGVHKTIVNGLLDTFSNSVQKDAIKMEFLRMGLTYDGSKWALSGLDGTSLITIEPTTIWVNGKKRVKVPAKMVLGNEVSQRLDYTLFENNGKYFLVNSKSVQYI